MALRRILLTVAITATLALGTAAPALAQAPIDRGCPPSFGAYDRQEQYVLGEEHGLSPSDVDALIDRFDTNGDTVLCFMQLPLRTGLWIVLDNRAAGA